MQESCPCGNPTAEWRVWLVSLLESEETTDVGGVHGNWEPEPLINPHDKIAMLISEPLEWCNWLDSQALMLNPSVDWATFLAFGSSGIECFTRRSQRQPESQICFCFKKTWSTPNLSSLPLFSASFFLPVVYLSYWRWSITALCLPLPPLSIAVAAVADSCVTQAPEKPEPPTRKVEATDPSLSPTDPCPPGSSILLPACNGGLQVTYLSTPLWAQRTVIYWSFTSENKNLLKRSTRQI